MRLSHIRGLAGLTALSGLAFITYATLSPLQDRPQLASQGVEHVAAFAALGGLLTVAYPRRVWTICGFLIVVAVGLEAAQHLAMNRHGRVIDAGRKIAGGAIGVALGWVANRVLTMRLTSLSAD